VPRRAPAESKRGEEDTVEDEKDTGSTRACTRDPPGPDDVKIDRPVTSIAVATLKEYLVSDSLLGPT